MCKNWREKGSCRYGDRCLFAHGNDEIVGKSSPVKEEPPKEEKKFETPTKSKTAQAEADQVGSDSTQATMRSPPAVTQKQREQTSPLDLVLRGDIDDALDRDMLKAFSVAKTQHDAVGEGLFGSISDMARQVSPLNFSAAQRKISEQQCSSSTD